MASCLVTIPAKRLGTMAVIIKNETEHDVVIPPETVMAEISAVQQVTPLKSDPNTSDLATDQPDVNIYFADSPSSADWKERITNNNSIRLCIDYRKLNTQTIKDASALPNLEEALSVLSGSKWFSVLDLKSGYYQIEMEEADKERTACVCPLGFYEIKRMPQGVTNSPITFQRLMERCMGDLNLKVVQIFIDDLIIFSDTREEHEERLMRVLVHLKEYGLKLSPEKCRFFQSSVRYLGSIVSQNGIETDQEKV